MLLETNGGLMHWRKWLLVAGIALPMAAFAQATTRKNPDRPTLSVPSGERDAVAASINGVLELLPPARTVACVVLRGSAPDYWYNPDSTLLSRVQGSRLRVVADRDCPYTYESMVWLVDSAGNPLNLKRPPDYVDPYRLEIMQRTMDATRASEIQVRVGRGTSNLDYRCALRRARLGRWVATCE